MKPDVLTAAVPHEPEHPPGSDAIEIGRLARELSELRRANERLEARLLELDALVEQRTRRTNQLIGERAQLSARLAERDQRVQELSWELGAASMRARPAQPAVAPAWLARIGAWITDLAPRAPEPGAAARPAPPAARGEADAEQTAVSLVPFHGEGPPLPIVAIAAFGLAGSDLVRMLDIVERHCADRGLRPLILTDHDALAILRARRLLFEYLPPPDRRRIHGPQLDWDLYLQRRLALIRRKWRPVRIIPFGQRAADMVALWSESPFEDPSLAQLLARHSSADP